jgi:hypothetical protein
MQVGSIVEGRWKLSPAPNHQLFSGAEHQPANAITFADEFPSRGE